jgi:phage-related protein
MKVVRFLGDSLKAIREFPRDARQNAGRQLEKVQGEVIPTTSNRCRTLARELKRSGYEANPELSG